MFLQKKLPLFFYSFLLIALLQSCEKKDIQFATDLGESYTNIISLDTIGVNMSTYFIDSFPVTNPATLLLGRYKDPELGTVSAKPCMQFSPPADLTIPDNVLYDSATLVIKMNKYYYGDTLKPQTIIVKELNAAIAYTYGNNIYNTSSIAEKPGILGTKNLLIRPNKDDSIIIRLDDTKGLELFTKIKEGNIALQNQADFSNYFKGVSISFSNTDSTAIYGLTDSVYMRVHYHTTIPYRTDMSKDFLWYYSGLFYNQLLSDRSGTPLSSLLNGTKEIASALVNNKGYTQGSAGVFLKATFPTARSILQLSSNIKVLKATLRLRVERGSYDEGILRLPQVLYLASTDGSNTLGAALPIEDGSEVNNTPITDNIYDAVPYYNFDVTSYINTLVASGGLQDYGVFVLESTPGQNNRIGRAVFSNSTTPSTGSQLILTLLTVKN